MDASIPFAQLTPEVVVAAVAAAGFVPDGRILALNSYENRVWQVGLEDAQPLVAKFYRPARWTDAALLEEHAFALELARAEIPVVAPLECEGATLLRHESFRYALYPRRGGRWADLDLADDRVRLGRFLGRLHRVGGAGRFEHRAVLAVDWMAERAAETVLEGDWLPDYLVARYREVVDEIAGRARDLLDAVQPRRLRIHGDCHRGNILWTDAGPHFVDLDDCMTGPAVQDLWMLLAGARDETAVQLRDLLEGYEQFMQFDRAELALVEPLRALRMVHYAAWLARRWTDPAFPRAFPWFGAARFWEEHVGQLVEQLDALDQPPIRVH